MVYVWIKVGHDGQATEIVCEQTDNINRLKIKIKQQLPKQFIHVDHSEIIVRNADNQTIDPGDNISFELLGTNSKNPFLVDTPALPSTGKPLLFVRLTLGLRLLLIRVITIPILHL